MFLWYSYSSIIYIPGEQWRDVLHREVKKFASSALSHPVVHAYHNEWLGSTDNLLLSNFSFEAFRCSNRVRPSTRFKDVFAYLHFSNISGTATSHSLSHVRRLPCFRLKIGRAIQWRRCLSVVSQDHIKGRADPDASDSARAARYYTSSVPFSSIPQQNKEKEKAKSRSGHPIWTMMWETITIESKKIKYHTKIGTQLYHHFT
jgi:hypothetical protein